MEVKVYHVPYDMLKDIPKWDPVLQSHWAWEHQGDYIHVGTIECDTPEEAYALSRNVEGEWDENDPRISLEVDCPRGTDVGDVFYQNGYPYVVGDFGEFHKVVRPPTEKELRRLDKIAAEQRERNKTPEQREMEQIAREALKELEEETTNNLKKPPT